ncbi:MAG: hypothetical protein ACKPJJ_20060, partial [Planctomycetaceae bacterium]
RSLLSDAGVHLKIALSSATAASGFASWEIYTPVGSGTPKRQFRAEVWNLPSGSQHSVTVAGVVVGSVTANAKGFARLTFEDGDLARKFPGNWPQIATDTVVTVGNTVSGVVRATGQTL